MTALKPTPSKLYLLDLYYPSAQSAAAKLAQARRIVQTVAGTNWRLLTPGNSLCTIGFESTMSATQLQGHFDPLCADQPESFAFLLVEVSQPVTGFLGRDVWQWLARHQRPDSKTQS